MCFLKQTLKWFCFPYLIFLLWWNGRVTTHWIFGVLGSFLPNHGEFKTFGGRGKIKIWIQSGGLPKHRCHGIANACNVPAWFLLKWISTILFLFDFAQIIPNFIMSTFFYNWQTSDHSPSSRTKWRVGADMQKLICFTIPFFFTSQFSWSK